MHETVNRMLGVAQANDYEAEALAEHGVELAARASFDAEPGGLDEVVAAQGDVVAAMVEGPAYAMVEPTPLNLDDLVGRPLDDLLKAFVAQLKAKPAARVKALSQLRNRAVLQGMSLDEPLSLDMIAAAVSAGIAADCASVEKGGR
jgi:hypothetical protein